VGVGVDLLVWRGVDFIGIGRWTHLLIALAGVAF
jgi:hypothetical protein